MLRRLCRVVLPVLMITIIISGMFLGAGLYIQQTYRRTANAEMADLVGLISQQYPELDASDLIRTLSAADDTTRVTGEAILRSYGYLEDDFVSPSHEAYSATILLASCLTVGCVGLALAGYLCYREWRHRQQIRDLVTYVQKLNQRIYDLRIETNTEDELSLLANELYKITVTLKESAEYDHRTLRRLETALADISHQLKTPLTSLQITLDNLLGDPDMPPAVRQDFLRAVSFQISSMSSLVSTLLNLAKFDSGTIRLQRQIMPIGDILHRVVDKLEILADLQDVRLELAGDLAAQVKLDPHWQVEALANIVKNCIEHSTAGQSVILTVEDSILYTRVTIRDHGTGIAPKDLHHIFERFYKADHSDPSSIGIGLAFARTVIRADNGQVRAKSHSGDGSSFIVTYFH